jgi:hypothetical protein
MSRQGVALGTLTGDEVQSGQDVIDARIALGIRHSHIDKQRERRDANCFPRNQT